MSRAIQNNWADDSGRVQLVDLDHGSVRPTSTINSMVASHFSSVRSEAGNDDRLEQAWSRLEGEALPVLSSLISGKRDLGRDACVELTVLAAIHVVRSFSTRRIHDRILSEAAPEFAADHMQEAGLIAAWQAEFGTTPTYEGLLEITTQLTEGYRSSNSLYVDRQVSIYNQVVEEFQRRHVRLVFAKSRAVPFVLGDNAAYPFDGFRVGIHNGVGVLSAPEVRMPLAPTLALVISKQPGSDLVLSATDTQRWNQITRRSASRFLVTEIGTDWKRVTAK